MEHQELKYLRDELNRMCLLHYEYASKTIHIVLLIWGGVLILLGKDGLKFTAANFENIILCFIVATVFFVSNIVLYYTALKYHNHADIMFKLAAYIAVFYEKWPSSAAKIGSNGCWELATFEIANNPKYKQDAYKKNFEYFALTAVSVGLMFLLLVVFLFNIPKECGMEQIVSLILLQIYLIYLGFSIYWFCKIPKYTYSRDSYGMKVQHMKNFIRFALDTEQDDEKALKDRLGGVWDLIYGEK